METYCNEKISDFDLCGTQYSIDVLTKHMHYLNKKVVLNTQDLTADFCVRFILDCPIEPGYESSGIYSKCSLNINIYTYTYVYMFIYDVHIIFIYYRYTFNFIFFISLHYYIYSVFVYTVLSYY